MEYLQLLISQEQNGVISDLLKKQQQPTKNKQTKPTTNKKKTPTKQQKKPHTTTKTEM